MQCIGKKACRQLRRTAYFYYSHNEALRQTRENTRGDRLSPSISSSERPRTTNRRQRQHMQDDHESRQREGKIVRVDILKTGCREHLHPRLHGRVRPNEYQLSWNRDVIASVIRSIRYTLEPSSNSANSIVSNKADVSAAARRKHDLLRFSSSISGLIESSATSTASYRLYIGTSLLFNILPSADIGSEAAFRLRSSRLFFA